MTGAPESSSPPNDPAALGQRNPLAASIIPAEACRMGAAGRARVLERFTWDRVVQQCLAIYDGTGGVRERAAA